MRQSRSAAGRARSHDAEGVFGILEAVGQLAATVPSANWELPSAIWELPDAIWELPDAIWELPDANRELPDAIWELPDANRELPGGVRERWLASAHRLRHAKRLAERCHLLIEDERELFRGEKKVGRFEGTCRDGSLRGWPSVTGSLLALGQLASR